MTDWFSTKKSFLEIGNFELQKNHNIFFTNDKIYKNNIDKNLSLSENNINNTSTAFDKLQDDINDKLNDINQKNNDLIINEPKKLNTLNSNLNKLFNIIK